MAREMIPRAKGADDMTTREMETMKAQPTLTEFVAGFGLHYPWLYADDSSREPVDPDADRAVFTARDSFMAWEALHCIAPHIAAIRSSVRLNDDGDIIVPLGIAEITAASAAVGNLLRDYDDRTRRFRLRNSEHTPAGRIVRAIYRETIQLFIMDWEDSFGHYDEPYRPTQWTHEYSSALGELLRTLDREAAMLATIAGTSRTDSPHLGEFATLSLPEHIARYELGLEWGIEGSPTRAELRPQDIYTAAYLVWALDSVEAWDALDSPRTGAEGRMAHILGASEAVHTAVSAALDTWSLRSRMSVILDAFIHDVALPTLRVYGASVAVHLVLDSARMRSPVGDARAAFISEVVAPSLSYSAGDLPHYERFASRLRGLHALARELAGEMCLFSGNFEEEAEAPSA